MKIIIILKILNIMDIMKIFNIMNFMNITAWMAISCAVLLISFKIEKTVKLSMFLFTVKTFVTIKVVFVKIKVSLKSTADKP